MKIYLAQSYPNAVGGGVVHTGNWMRLFLADTGNNHFDAGQMIQPIQMRLLVSYHYYKTTNFDEIIGKYFAPTKPDIFADSGAFSAMTQGASINIDEYGQWLNKWGPHFTVYCNLDVIGDPQASERNQRHLEDKHGLTPLPVFHVGSDWKHLEKLVDEYDYIALGGMVPHLRYTKRIMKWLIQCFKIAKGKAVFHGLGSTNWTVIRSLPWHSVDSSAWGQGFRYGVVPVWMAKSAKFVKLPLGDMQKAYQHREDLKRLNIKPEQIGDREQNTRQINAYVAAMSYHLAELWLTKRWGNARIYLVESGGSTLGHKEVLERINEQ